MFGEGGVSFIFDLLSGDGWYHLGGVFCLDVCVYVCRWKKVGRMVYGVF